MTRTLPASPSVTDTPLSEDFEAERLAAEGWPVLRGTAAQRDARFVLKLLKAQLSLIRGRR